MPTPDPILTALCGPAGAGKDTVADYLVEHHGYTKLAFADALRDEVGRAFDISVQLLTQRETKEHPMSALALQRCMDFEFVQRMAQQFASGLHGANGIAGERISLSSPRSPRQIMQWWGTEYRRAQAPHYWVDAFMTRLIKEHQQGNHRFVVTDVRNTNEAELLREMGASLWQITRPGFDIPPGAHSSETTGAEFAPDFQLLNDHSITHLHKQAYAALTKSAAAKETA